MKKAIALLLAALMLLLCGCASQTNNEKEGTAGQPAVSSDSETNPSGGAVDSTVAGQPGGSTASTLPQAEDGGEASAIPFDDGDNSGSNGDSNNTTTTTTEKTDNKEGTTAPERTTEDSSGEGISMPRVPIPQH